MCEQSTPRFMRWWSVLEMAARFGMTKNRGIRVFDSARPVASRSTSSGQSESLWGRAAWFQPQALVDSLIHQTSLTFTLNIYVDIHSGDLTSALHSSLLLHQNLQHHQPWETALSEGGSTTTTQATRISTAARKTHGMDSVRLSLNQ